uniref:Protoheme IX farnesyltransferase n=1 Tax=Candidatus Aschnera chinzeii TaxID=1485666 RepID=A0AAT9G3R7_9ENTR|nr:MAG: heme o synthase [Candidatus Aschnera chinzeii]
MLNNTRHYLIIIKPRIVFANIIAVITGFLSATNHIGSINYSILFTIIIGETLIVSSACIFNNYIDMDIDRMMTRTKTRPLAAGLINVKHCLIYAILLGISGIIILSYNVSKLSILLTIIAFIIYVILYSLYMKRHSIHAILIGSISGAIPPLAGYYAVYNNYHLIPVMLFLIYSIWQIAHSYAINIFRLNDYQKAQIPILPLKLGITITKIYILISIITFIISIIILFFISSIKYYYLLITTIVNLYWLLLAIIGCKNNNGSSTLWAKKIFIYSIITIIVFNIMLSIGTIDK